MVSKEKIVAIKEDVRMRGGFSASDAPEMISRDDGFAMHAGNGSFCQFNLTRTVSYFALFQAW